MLLLQQLHPDLVGLAGVHRIQRIPVNDRRGRRHTSTATMAVLEAPDESPVDLDDADLDIHTKRGSGSGGQHRNTTDSAVEIRHRPTGAVVQIDSGRSQHQNIALARRILATRLASLESVQRDTERNDARRGQIATGERSAKDWTWNSQRNQVVNHRTGTHYDLARLKRGRI